MKLERVRSKQAVQYCSASVWLTAGQPRIEQQQKAIEFCMGGINLSAHYSPPKYSLLPFADLKAAGVSATE